MRHSFVADPDEGGLVDGRYSAPPEALGEETAKMSGLEQQWGQYLDADKVRKPSLKASERADASRVRA